MQEAIPWYEENSTRSSSMSSRFDDYPRLEESTKNFATGSQHGSKNITSLSELLIVKNYKPERPRNGTVTARNINPAPR